MSTSTRHRRLPPSDLEIRELARYLIAERSPNGAARTLGVGRQTALSLAAGAWCIPGTFAVIRERVARSAELCACCDTLRSAPDPKGAA